MDKKKKKSGFFKRLRHKYRLIIYNDNTFEEVFWIRLTRLNVFIVLIFGAFLLILGKLRDLLGIPLEEMIFIGDALFVGGNDYPAEEAGVFSIPVRGPDETKQVTEAIIACLDRSPQA